MGGCILDVFDESVTSSLDEKQGQVSRLIGRQLGLFQTISHTAEVLLGGNHLSWASPESVGENTHTSLVFASRRPFDILDAGKEKEGRKIGREGRRGET